MKHKTYFLSYERLDDFFSLLKKKYKIIGPRLENNHIVYDKITASKELPWGYVAKQGLGTYELKKTSEKRLFDWVNSTFAAKPKLFKPKELQWTVERDEKGQLKFNPCEAKPQKLAFFGIRPCDLRAIYIQDEVFLNSRFKDPKYKAHRENNFIIVANCALSSNNCFCVAMGDFPKADNGFDVALTEIKDGFLFELGNEDIEIYAQTLQLPVATNLQQEAAKQAVGKAAKMQNKKIKSKNLPKDLFNNLNHSYWDTVADQCLSCGNCTQVCPTCFCHNEIEEPNLSGEVSEHSREWGSCFTKEHSYIHGKTIRETIKSRYKQWLTHKFGSWQQQFGTNGCVGCGRCMTWCPTGIDTVEVLNHICKDDSDES